MYIYKLLRRSCRYSGAHSFTYFGSSLFGITCFGSFRLVSISDDGSLPGIALSGESKFDVFYIIS